MLGLFLCVASFGSGATIAEWGGLSSTSLEAMEISRRDLKWVAGPDGPRLIDPKGNVHRRHAARAHAPWDQLIPRGVFFMIGRSGRHVLFFANDLGEPVGTSLEFRDSRDRPVWRVEKVAISQEIWTSDDGTRTMFLVVPRFLNAEEEAQGEDGSRPDWFSETVVIMDEKARQVFRSGPYREVMYMKMSRNGRYAIFRTSEKGYSFVNVRSGRMDSQPDLLGEIELRESGHVIVDPPGRPVRRWKIPD